MDHFPDRGRDRTVDQMQQAARSGKQNIVEGYSDAEGSTEIEHKLTVIAKGSLEELKEDYLDYLRTHHLEIWGPQHDKYKICQSYFKRNNDSAWYRKQIEGGNPEEIANMALIVIFQTLAMIKRPHRLSRQEILAGRRHQRAALPRRSAYQEKNQGYRWNKDNGNKQDNK